MISAFLRAFSALQSATIRRILWQTLVLAACTMLALGLLVWFLADLFFVRDLSGWLGGLLGTGSALALLVIAWLAFPASVSGILSLFAERIVDVLEARDYPALALPRAQSLGESVLSALALAGAALLANLLALPFLVFPPLYFLIVYGMNGYLLGREYFEIVAARRLDRPAVKALFQQRRGTIVTAGVLIAIILSIPILNLLAPVIGIAFMTHLYHRTLAAADIRHP